MAQTRPNKMSKEEKENRYLYVISLFRKGWSKLTITEHLAELWGIKRQAASNWIKQTYGYMNQNSESFIRNLRRIQLERLELMLMKAMEKEDWKVANTIAETINRLFGLYEIKQKIEITDNVIRFKFNDGKLDDTYKHPETEIEGEYEEILNEANNLIIN